ncbi:hypothetical protein JOC34_003443 [Virgibacillus halotolerans]|nr:hypothetical protein [Virgibacillus halotolerans]
MSLIPGIVILLVTWWFKKMNFSLFVRIMPGIFTVIASIILFYIGLVNIRGFEGSAYGILAFYLIVLAVVSLVIVNKKTISKN